MTNVEPNRLSTLSAVRKVGTPSESLKQFQYAARELVNSMLPEARRPDAEVYYPDVLRVTLYERQLVPSKAGNKLLEKLYRRLASETVRDSRIVPEQSGTSRHVRGPDVVNLLPVMLEEQQSLHKDITGPLLTMSDQLADITRPSLRGEGVELALVLGSASVAALLTAQSESIVEVADKAVNSRGLRGLRGMEASQRARNFESGALRHIPSSLLMPVLYAPIPDPLVQEELREQLSADLPVHGIEIGPIQWKLNKVEPAED